MYSQERVTITRSRLQIGTGFLAIGLHYLGLLMSESAILMSRTTAAKKPSNIEKFVLIIPTKSCKKLAAARGYLLACLLHVIFAWRREREC